MGQRFALIAVLLASLMGFNPGEVNAASIPDQGPRWESLSPEVKQVLTPVAPDWDHMPGFQRQRLVNAAKNYPKLSQEEKNRFRERLPQWAKLPHETRVEARETFKKFHSLPEDKRQELKKRWHAEKSDKPEETGASSADSASPSSSTR